jgi:hypothetical protein
MSNYEFEEPLFNGNNDRSVNINIICNADASAYNLDNSTTLLTMTTYLKIVSNKWNFAVLISSAFFLGCFLTSLIFICKDNLIRKFKLKREKKKIEREMFRIYTANKLNKSRNIVYDGHEIDSGVLPSKIL